LEVRLHDVQLAASKKHVEHRESQGSQVWLAEMNRLGRGQLVEQVLLNKTVPAMQVRQNEDTFWQDWQGDWHKVQLELVELVKVLLGQASRQLPLK
jgi:hypothetical protein